MEDRADKVATALSIVAQLPLDRPIRTHVERVIREAPADELVSIIQTGTRALENTAEFRNIFDSVIGR